MCARVLGRVDRALLLAAVTCTSTVTVSVSVADTTENYFNKYTTTLGVRGLKGAAACAIIPSVVVLVVGVAP